MKRFLAIVLCLVMLLGTLPASAFAQEPDEPVYEETEPVAEQTEQELPAKPEEPLESAEPPQPEPEGNEQPVQPEEPVENEEPQENGEPYEPTESGEVGEPAVILASSLIVISEGNKTELYVGKTLQLRAVYKPDIYNAGAFKWSLRNEDLAQASISSTGLVTAKK